jgi:thioredoxin 1
MGDKTQALTDDKFDSEVVKSETPVLVDFWAPWCGPCVAIGPIVDQLAAEYDGKVKVMKMNIDENANVPATYGVRSIPHIALFKGGEVVDLQVGVVPKSKLVDMIEKVL